MQLVVACLCAEWCSTCREYRGTFERAAEAFKGVRFLWVDVEDQSGLVEQVDVENFPTLLIGVGKEPVFFGPVTPQEQTLLRMIKAHLTDTTTRGLSQPEVRALMDRLGEASGDDLSPARNPAKLD